MTRLNGIAERELIRETSSGNDYVEICTTEKVVKNLKEFYDTCRRIAIAQIERGVLSHEEAVQLFKNPDELDSLGYKRIKE